MFDKTNIVSASDCWQYFGWWSAWWKIPRCYVMFKRELYKSKILLFVVIWVRLMIWTFLLKIRLCINKTIYCNREEIDFLKMEMRVAIDANVLRQLHTFRRILIKVKNNEPLSRLEYFFIQWLNLGTRLLWLILLIIEIIGNI